MMAGCLLVVMPAGCATSGTGRNAAGTQIDRLMQAYDDLSGGRFVVIADFEKADHMELISLDNASTESGFRRDRQAGRALTGKSALQFDSASENDAIIFSNAQAEQWFLKRDWRDYDLLLMSIRSPRAGLHAEVSITVGQGENEESVHSIVSLEKGWNLTRLDLADVADHIPLDDVEQLRIAVTGADDPVCVTFDDVILASNRRVIFGDPKNQDGKMFVVQSGRRWHVGAGGRYELIFSHGQIVGWYNLAQDPYRQRNLVAGTTLTPMPIVLGQGGPADGFAKLGKAVRVHPQILEISDVRIVVAAEWVYVDSPDKTILNRPFQKWRYTMYPSGQVFVSVACTSRTEEWSAPDMGLTVGLTVESADGVQTETKADVESPPTFATASSESAGYELLFTLGEPSRFTRTQDRRANGTREISFVATGASQDAEVRTWVCELALLDGASEVEVSPQQLARLFWEPVDLDMHVGSAVEGGSPFMTKNGFDRESGSYRLVPEQGTCRFTVDGTHQQAYSPAFTILDSIGLDAWVYVDHLLFTDIGRDMDGNVVFQLPTSVKKPTVVEVLTRRRAQPDDA
jgi:hypothetical protein